MTSTEKFDLSAFSVQSATMNLQNSIIILFMSQAHVMFVSIRDEREVAYAKIIRFGHY